VRPCPLAAPACSLFRRTDVSFCGDTPIEPGGRSPSASASAMSGFVSAASVPRARSPCSLWTPCVPSGMTTVEARARARPMRLPILGLNVPDGITSPARQRVKATPRISGAREPDYGRRDGAATRTRRRSRYAVPLTVRPGRINTNDQVVTVLHGVHHPVLGNDLQFELRIRERETYLCAASTTCANTTDALTRRRPPETGARDVIASPASSISASKPWVLS